MKKLPVRLPEPLLVHLLSNQLSLVVTPTGAYCQQLDAGVPFDQENLQIKWGLLDDGSCQPSPDRASASAISKQQLVLHIKRYRNAQRQHEQ